MAYTLADPTQETERNNS